jgi:hypothetical protein
MFTYKYSSSKLQKSAKWDFLKHDQCKLKNYYNIAKCSMMDARNRILEGICYFLLCHYLS